MEQVGTALSGHCAGVRQSSARLRLRTRPASLTPASYDTSCHRSLIYGATTVLILLVALNCSQHQYWDRAKNTRPDCKLTKAIALLISRRAVERAPTNCLHVRLPKLLLSKRFKCCYRVMCVLQFDNCGYLYLPTDSTKSVTYYYVGMLVIHNIFLSFQNLFLLINTCLLE